MESCNPLRVNVFTYASSKNLRVEVAQPVRCATAPRLRRKKLWCSALLFSSLVSM